jgi:hypothetical protein
LLPYSKVLLHNGNKYREKFEFLRDLVLVALASIRSDVQ